MDKLIHRLHIIAYKSDIEGIVTVESWVLHCLHIR